MSKAISFKQNLGREIVKFLPDSFKYFSTSLEFKEKTKNGYNVISLSGKNKHSPYIYVSFEFGVKFSEVSKIEKIMGCDLFKTHISQDTDFILDYAKFPYIGPVKWEVDINSPPENLAKEVAFAMKQLAFPFFERFPEIEDARNELEKEKESWCYSFHWMQLFHLNAALQEVSRFENWSSSLDDFQKKIAADYVNKYNGLAG